MAHRYRTLIIAEQANPEWSSVPLIGWSLSQALGTLTDAHVVTQVRNREAFLRAGLVEDRDFTAIDSEHVAAPLWKIGDILRGGAGKGWTTVTAISAVAYYAFEAEVWRRFGPRLRKREFDLVHRITPLSPTAQSLIAKRVADCGIPFILGPLNGGLPWPKHFVGRQHSEKEWLAHIRGLHRLMPFYKSTRKYSSAIIAGSKHTYDAIPGWAKEKAVYIPENGVDPERFNRPRTHSATLPLRAAFVGRLVPYKGADILLEAAEGFLKKGELEIVILGEGPHRPHLEAVAKQLGVEEKVRFLGSLPHREVQTQLRLCDFLALPSIREFGGGVVIESMALGVTPIVADYGGPSELVDDNTGIRIAFQDENSLREGMKNAIASLISTPGILDTMGAAGQAKVQAKLTWERKAAQIYEVYEAVLRGEKNLRCLGYSS